MSNKLEEKYVGTPLLEGATTLMLIGGNELGREILIEAHRLGLETILISDHQYAPASHLSHRQHVIRLDDDEALRAIIRREQPEIIVQDSPAIAPQTIESALEDLKPAIYPNPSLANFLQDPATALEVANRAKAGVVPFAKASSAQELQETCTDLCLPCLVRETNPSSDTPETLARSQKDIDSIIDSSKKSDGQARFLVKRFLPYDLNATVYAIATNMGSREESFCLSQPIGTFGTSDSPHVSWQPLWTIDEHTRMSAAPFSGHGAALHRKEEGSGRDYLWESELNGRYIPADVMKDVDGKLRDYSIKTLRTLQEDSGKPINGLVRLDFGVRLRAKESGNKPEVYLNEISPYANDTAMVTLATQQPTIPACIVRTALGIQVASIQTTASGAAHVVQARQKSGWAPAFFNIGSACKQEGTFIQLFGKHRFSALEPVGMAFALDDDILKAREKALNCAHKVEEGIDYGS